MPPGELPFLQKEWKASFPIFGAAALVFVTWSVWQTTGSRISLFLCAATATAAAVDVVWAQVATGRVAVRVTGNPAEAIAGDPVTLTLDVGGPRQLLTVAVDAVGAPMQSVEVPQEVPFRGHAPSRRVMTDIVVTYVGHGVAGMLGCLRRRRIHLARPMAIGPRPLPAADAFPDLLNTWGEGEARAAPSGDLVRGVRPYVAGDPMRRVHWRTTARVGDLVVKEVEDIDAPRLMIVLDMGSGGVAGERAAGRASWYALEGMRRSYWVVLATVEHQVERGATHARAVTAPVTSASDVTRRLAAAAAPGQPEVPSGAEAGRSVLLITDRGDSWR